MKCIVYDLRRALLGRWFAIAVAITAGTLWLSIGSESYYLLDYLDYMDEMAGYTPDFYGLLRDALTGNIGLLTLPALSALPYAAEALREMRSGAARYAIFRAGRGAYTWGHAVACFVSGAVLQALAFALLAAVLTGMMVFSGGAGVPYSDIAAALPLLAGRMLCGALWASVGCVVALLTETALAAYVAPLCCSYALTMIGTRFFPESAYLSPMNWPSSGGWPLAALAAALLLAAWRTTGWEVRKYV